MKTLWDYAAKAFCFVTGHQWYRPMDSGYEYCLNCGEYRKGWSNE